MEIVNLKYRYIFASVCLLGVFLVGYNFNRWHKTSNRVRKHISIIYSFSKNDSGYGKFEEFIVKEFREQGIEPVLDRFYLGADDDDLQDETRRMQEYLEFIKNKSVDLILTSGDQAAHSLLSTRHSLLQSLPVVACNVHFPNEKLLSEYESGKVYVLRDSPDFRRNIEFIRVLQAHANLEVFYNVDFTPLGRKSFKLLTKVVDRQNVRVLSSEASFHLECEYRELQEMVEYYSLMPAVAREANIKKNKLTISLCPFRYMKGTSLLLLIEKSKDEQGKKAFLLDKFDAMALPIVKALDVPVFSCLREGFGEGTKIVGGYMATDENSARTAVDLSVRLLKKKETCSAHMRDIEKEYVLDWKYFSACDGLDIKNVPSGVRIINYPFYDHYREELYFLGAVFVLAFILVSVILLRTRRRSRIEHENLAILEEAHKRLTLSADGGRISLWNIQGDEIEFDENYLNLTGLEISRFTKAEFLKFVHSDDLQEFNSFTETLTDFSDMLIHRARFCFIEKDGYQWYEFRCRSLKNTRGGTMLAGIMQNVQAQVDHERQLILAKQMAEKAELKQSFLNNMSHEIRTPLNAIVGFTNLLVSEEADEIDPEEKADMLKIINSNNNLLLKLIDDMVEIARLDSGNMDFEIKEWDMTDVLKEIYKAYQPLIQPSLRFHLELNDTPLPVHIDCLRFTQVISNFLGNANKFTSSGHITLGCRVDREHNELCVYVEDTGKGIDEKELAMIFDRFYKTDEFGQGSGLGLSISKGIVERLSGRIEVCSKVGQGSYFAVILPL